MLKAMRKNLKSLAPTLWFVIIAFIISIFAVWGGAGRLGEGQKAENLATVGKAEGPTYGIARCVMDKPGRWGFKGDLNDRKAFEKWAVRKACDIAIQTGYICTNGSEVRVRTPGKVAYVPGITPEGRYFVEEYVIDESGEFKADPEQVSVAGEKPK